jgi:Zn-dependent protease with chaperone function
MVLVSVAVLLASGTAAVWFGLPALAKSIAFSLPEPVVDGLGRHVLEYLDKGFFSPSTLSEERRTELREKFGDFLRKTGDVKERRILFRAGGALGANAFALPSGDIVLTDRLVLLAEDDEELVAVVAHECGHVDGRHILQSVIQTSALATLVSFMTGDASAVTAIGGALPLFLVRSKFSRGFERDADLYAVRRLSAGGISPTRLAEMLERLSKSRKRGDKEKCGDKEKDEDADSELVEYLSTHPPTAERKRMILEEARKLEDSGD